MLEYHLYHAVSLLDVLHISFCIVRVVISDQILKYLPGKQICFTLSQLIEIMPVNMKSMVENSLTLKVCLLTCKNRSVTSIVLGVLSCL